MKHRLCVISFDADNKPQFQGSKKIIKINSQISFVHIDETPPQIAAFQVIWDTSAKSMLTMSQDADNE